MKTTLFAVPLVFAIASPVLAQSDGLNEGHLKSLDSDSDSSISREEFDAFSGFAFQQMDTDKSGTLSPSEVDVHAPDGAFGRTDTNGDGSVSADEYQKRMNDVFDEADKDGDGQLN